MALSPVNTPSSVFAPNSSSGSSTSAASGLTGTNSASVAGGLGEMDFLKLLTTQLKAQDPTKPMNDTQFVSQMAQFTSLQETQQLNQNFQNFNQSMGQALDLQTLAQSSTLIGKEVFAGPDASHLTLGQVTEILQQSGQLKAVVQMPDGTSRNFSLNQIQQVGATAAEQAGYQEPATASSTSSTTLPAGFSPYPAAT